MKLVKPDVTVKMRRCGAVVHSYEEFGDKCPAWLLFILENPNTSSNHDQD